jgi:histidine triad (HIT) family protein
MGDCIFCKIIRKEIPAMIVWEDEHCVAFLDVRPVNPGHLLIVPKEHIESVFGMPDELYEGIFKTAKALSTPLQNAMRSLRVGIVVEGFGVPHAHMHLVPINKAHDLDSTRAAPMSGTELAAIGETIKQHIKNSHP